MRKYWNIWLRRATINTDTKNVKATTEIDDMFSAQSQNVTPFYRDKTQKFCTHVTYVHYEARPPLYCFGLCPIRWAEVRISPLILADEKSWKKITNIRSGLGKGSQKRCANNHDHASPNSVGFGRGIRFHRSTWPACSLNTSLYHIYDVEVVSSLSVRWLGHGCSLLMVDTHVLMSCYTSSISRRTVSYTHLTLPTIYPV